LDNFVAADTACGSNEDTECSNPDTCNGSGSCSTRNESNGTECTDGVCGAGLCILDDVPDAGSDAGLGDAGDAGPGAGGEGPLPGDASAGQGGNAPVGGTGGQGGTPIFNLGGNDSGVAGFAGFAGDLGFDAGGLLNEDGGLSAEAADLAQGCKCHLPGKDSSSSSSGALLVLGLAGLLWRRRKAA
jgi:MYXO-CTERM domain-containing protein